MKWNEIFSGRRDIIMLDQSPTVSRFVLADHCNIQWLVQQQQQYDDSAIEINLLSFTWALSLFPNWFIKHETWQQNGQWTFSSSMQTIHSFRCPFNDRWVWCEHNNESIAIDMSTDNNQLESHWIPVLYTSLLSCLCVCALVNCFPFNCMCVCVWGGN